MVAGGLPVAALGDEVEGGAAEEGAVVFEEFEGWGTEGAAGFVGGLQGAEEFGADAVRDPIFLEAHA